MMNERGLRRTLPDQSSGSVHTFGNPSHSSIINPILSKRVCFYKSGDPQFSGLRMVINNRTFKTFDALLDSLSKKVPLPFGVRNITTPRGVHAIYSLDELEDGKSYICSESRKVKPINLALARKKLPPWYHARPVSSRRRTVQQARFFPGRNIHRQEAVVVRTPKKLLVFRNGYPSVRHTVLLQKRTTPTFDSILEYISELMQFHVVKLHTPDGRRVDGLTGLILCSGTVVAAGREPFRSANYNAQKSPAPTRLPSKRSVLRRRKASNRKKKPLSYSSKSRHFSSLSERYIVERIQNSIAEGSCNLPRNPTNSTEMDSSHFLESVAEMEDGTCAGEGAEGQGCLLPTEDDIEKSFQVNQDGSMTVEMRVRLTIKEEETVHWTTTLTRSSAANQINAACLPELEAEQETCLSDSETLDLQNPVASINAINRDKTTDDDEDPPSLGNGALSKCSSDEDNIKVQTDIASPRRAPTPGHKTIRKKQASLESTKTVEEIEEAMVESYLYREQTEHQTMTEQYCMVKQSSTRPVPKPRRIGSVDTSTIDRRNVSTLNSANMTEILQIDSSEEEITETVLHIYEQQACQDNFLANICARETSTSGTSFCRPATSETGQFSFNDEFEPEPWRPSTASDSISIWRAGDMSVALPPQETGAMQKRKGKRQFPKSTIHKEKPQQREDNADKRIPLKPKVVKRRVRRLRSPGKRRKKTPAEATEKQKKANSFSSGVFIKGIYGTKPAKSMRKLKKRPTQSKDESVMTKGSQSADDTIKDSNVPSPQEINTTEKVCPETSALIASVTEVNQPRGILTRQPSMHQENKANKNKSHDVSESMALPAFNSSSSVTNEYVENWLEAAQLNPASYPNVERKKLEAIIPGKAANIELITAAAEEAKCQEEKLEMQSRSTIDSLPDNEQGMSVKQRIRSFETKSGPSVETTTAIQQVAHSPAMSASRKNSNTPTQNNTDEINPRSDDIFSEINPLTNMASKELASGSEGENKSRPVRISIQEATSSSTLSMEPLLPLSPSPPPPPPPTESAADVPEDAASVTSSPLYRLSSLSSQTSDVQPLSMSPTSDKSESLSDHTMGMITSIQTDIPLTPREAQLQRTPSIKRATLVSNLSLERKMTLRKACLDKYSSCSDETLEMGTSSFPVNTVADDVLPYDVCSTKTQHPTQQSVLDPMSSQTYISESPISVTSEEKISSDTISTSDAPTPSNLQSKETKANITPSSTQLSSPKGSVKKVKLMSSPSTERKPAKKLSPELSHKSPKPSPLHNHPPDKTMSPNVVMGKQAIPHISPSPERKQKLSKSKLQNIPSPYSQSLDMVSPPVRHRSSRKTLSRNVSSDNAPQPTNTTKRTPPSRSKRHQTRQSMKSPDELDKTSESSDQSDDNRMNEAVYSAKADRVKFTTDTQVSQPLNIAHQPNMKPVLDMICSSIKSIRQITQNKRPSCLMKSNSLPDFSSHVASTFGSSSKALLAFLSVVTLKEAITNFNMDELNANNVSCAEALKMIESLREIASIEDSHKLKTSLSDLQKSASKQLLESWRGFQELSDKCKSHSSASSYSEQDCVHLSSPDTEENVIDEIIGGLDIPETLKEELAFLSVDIRHERDNEVYSEVLYMRENSEDMQTCRDAVNKENQRVEKQQQCRNEDILNQGQADMSKTESRSCEVEKQDTVCKQREESVYIPETEHTYGGESGSDDEGQKVSSTHKDLEQEVSFEESVSSSEAGEQQSSERKAIRTLKEESREGDLSHRESDFEPPGVNYYVELNASRNRSTSSRESENLGQSQGSEDEQPDVECEELRNRNTLFDPAITESHMGSMGLNVSANKSMCNLDMDEASSSEDEQPEVEFEELKVIVEENLPDLDEEHESGEEEKHLSDHKEHMRTSKEANSWGEETEENKVSSENVDIHAPNTVRGDSSSSIEGQDSYIIRESVSSIEQSKNLAKRYSFDVEEDSGNDHTCCEERVKTARPQVKDKQTSSSTEEELSFCKKESSSAMVKQPEVAKRETAVGKHQTKDKKSESVAQMEAITKRSAVARKDAPFVSDAGEIPSESPTSQSTLCTQSAPQSSLSFSYDSSGVITTEPEGSRVKSIREMFLAKTSTDTQHRQKPSPNPNTSKLSKLRAETSTSGGYQTQTSSELSAGEEDSSRTPIAKGFVRRAIERLYGNKEKHDDASERLPSESKQKKKEHSSIFGHITRTKAMSELSYFNSTITMDTINEATRCYAFNAQVGPEDSVPIGKEIWLLKESTQMRKSLSDPVGINKNCPSGEGMCEDTEEHSPYSILSTKSEAEDTNKSQPGKCTYFSLPHASDSDICQDELSTASKDSAVETEDHSGATKTWAERNGMLPGVGISDFKMDNKVHPLIDVSPDGGAVVVQPGKGHGAVNRRLPEPDMLDVLYNFCGQHCPIL